MKSIPTRAVMPEGEPELAIAWGHLITRLQELEAECKMRERDGPETETLWSGRNWHYLCSIPRREDDGDIAYIHLFLHRGLGPAGDKLVLGVPSSKDWWPRGCASLPLQRTPARAALRLVS